MSELIEKEDAIKTIEAVGVFGYIECETKALIKDINAIPPAQPEHMSSCDVCAYNTPLSMDGKPCPCSYCPAEPCRMEGEES